MAVKSQLVESRPLSRREFLRMLEELLRQMRMEREARLMSTARTDSDIESLATSRRQFWGD